MFQRAHKQQPDQSITPSFDMKRVPPDVWRIIMQFLKANELATLTQVDKQISVIAKEEQTKKHRLGRFDLLSDAMVKTLAPYYLKVKKDYETPLKFLSRNANEQRMNDLNQLKRDIRESCDFMIHYGIDFLGSNHRANIRPQQGETPDNFNKYSNYLSYPFPFPVCKVPKKGSIFNYVAPDLIGASTSSPAADRHLRLLFRLQNELSYSFKIRDYEYATHLQKLIGMQLALINKEDLEICRSALRRTLHASEAYLAGQATATSTLKMEFDGLDLNMKTLSRYIEDRLAQLAQPVQGPTL